MAEHDVSRSERGREHREVLARPLDRPITGHEDSPVAMVMAVAASIPEQRSRGTGPERGAAGFVHERPQPHAERAEIEDRVDDARDRRATPDAPVLHQPVLEDSKRQRQGAHSSTSVRPVRCRKTSSSVERRTNTLSGWRPSSWTCEAVASPSSV